MNLSKPRLSQKKNVMVKYPFHSWTVTMPINIKPLRSPAAKGRAAKYVSQTY